MFGKEIKKARISLGYTQTDVAKATGIPQNTISWIENDKGIENIQQCLLIAEFFDISLDELIGRDKIKKDIKITSSFNNSNNSGNFNF